MKISAKKFNKGFTIAEIVVALVLISMVSIIATTVIIDSRQSSNNSSDEYFAVNLCNNSIAVFRSCETDEEFSARLNNILGLNVTLSSNEKATVYFDKNYNQTYESDHVYSCAYSFTDKEGFKELEVTVSKNAKSLYSMKFMREKKS